MAMPSELVGGGLVGLAHFTCTHIYTVKMFSKMQSIYFIKHISSLCKSRIISFVVDVYVSTDVIRRKLFASIVF
jgi:hypothetical protein